MRTQQLALACVLCLMGSSVMAASQAFASISGLTFTVTDLDGNDGVESAYWINRQVNDEVGSNWSVSTGDRMSGDWESISGGVQQIFYERTVSSNSGVSSASAGISEQGVVASGSAYGPLTEYSAMANTGAYLHSGLTLALSAHSELTISAMATVDVWADRVCFEASASSYHCSFDDATASVGMALDYGYRTANDPIIKSNGGYVTVSLVPTNVLGNVANSSLFYPLYVTNSPTFDQYRGKSSVLSAVFTNTSDTLQYATFYLQAGVYGKAYSVPEPSSIAMYALGLMGLAGAVSRRRRQAAD